MFKKLLFSLFLLIAIEETLSAQYWNTSGNSDTGSTKLGTINSQPVRIYVKNAERMRIDSQGRVGIGTTNPVNILTLQTSGGTPSSKWAIGGKPVFASYGEGTAGNSDFVMSIASDINNARPVFITRRSRGTLAAPTAVTLNDYLGSYLTTGYDGTNFQNSAAVDFFVDGAPTSGNVPVRISFVTGTNGFNRTERLKIGSTGNIYFNNNQLYLQQSNGALAMGTTSPNASAILDINASKKGILIPRMTMAQRDSIASPATGLLIYQTDSTSGFYYYSGSWKQMAASIGNYANTQLSNLTATSINKDLNPDSTAKRNLGANNLSWNKLYLNNGLYIQGEKFITAGTDVYAGSIAIGPYSLAKLDSASSYYNTATGFYSMTSNTSGFENSAYGYYTLYGNTTGNDNTAAGALALSANSTGSNNTGIGSYSLYSNDTGSLNTAVGYYAIKSNVRGGRNTAIGANSLYNNVIGNNNTSIGYHSLYLQTGENNTAIGYSAGDFTTGATNSSFIGSQSQASVNNLINATALGYNTIVPASNAVRVGNTSVTSIGGPVGWTNYSDGRFKTNVKENVPGIEFIKKLRPVTYHFDVNALDKALSSTDKGESKLSVIEQKAKEEKSKIVYTGFIAQEVEKAAKEMNYNFSGVDAPKNEKDIYGLRYAEFVVPLVKAVQELNKKTEEIDELKKEIAELKQMVTALANNAKPIVENNTSVKLSDVTLDQNDPNPFSKTTRVSYNIPAGFRSAEIVITNTGGQIIKQIPLGKAGKGSINIDASLLSPGTYSYTIYIDGRTVQTKKMMVTR